MGCMHPAEVDFFHSSLLDGDTLSVAELFMKTGKGSISHQIPSICGKTRKAG